ncbi:hypothetical protein GCM10029964_024310 [Kibdelosporangium lantanae]
MRLAERGLTALKFFPAEAAGGVDYLKSIAGPLPGLRFCPTGGITLATVPAYLALPTVGCVGGSWLTPRDALAARDFARVESLAKEAAALPADGATRSRAAPPRGGQPAAVRLRASVPVEV